MTRIDKNRMFMKRWRPIFQRFQAGESAGVLAKEMKRYTATVYRGIKRFSQKTGIRLRQTKPIIRRNVVFTIAKEQLQPYLDGSCSLVALAKKLGRSVTTVREKIPIKSRRAAKSASKARTVQRLKAIYDEFMAGASMKKLAAKHKKSIWRIGTICNNYRKATGAPSKRSRGPG